MSDHRTDFQRDEENQIENDRINQILTKSRHEMEMNRLRRKPFQPPKVPKVSNASTVPHRSSPEDVDWNSLTYLWIDARSDALLKISDYSARINSDWSNRVHSRLLVLEPLKMDNLELSQARNWLELITKEAKIRKFCSIWYSLEYLQWILITIFDRSKFIDGKRCSLD